MGAFGLHCGPEDRERYLRSGQAKAPNDPPVTLTETELKMVDNWIERHPDPKPTRAEAVRRLLACALIEHPGQ